MFLLENGGGESSEAATPTPTPGGQVLVDGPIVVLGEGGRDSLPYVDVSSYLEPRKSYGEFDNINVVIR